jgi:hypothetical protein
MSWTYPQVKAAVAAITPAPASDQAAADTLNAQTVSPLVDIQLARLHAILLFNRDWAKVVRRSQKAPSGQPADAATDTAIDAAICLVELIHEMAGSPSVATSMTATWNALRQMLLDLQAVADVSPASLTALQNLRSPAVPRWDPPLTAADIAASRNA